MRHRKLPHLDLPEHLQFVTFRTAESLDPYLKNLHVQDLASGKKQLLADRHLDRSKRGAHLYAEALEACRNVLHAQDGESYDLIAYAIMPNHLHLLLVQKTDLPTIVRRIKAKSALEINKLLGRNGAFWAKDYYDRAVRDEKHLQTVYDYILNNPLKAELSDASERIYSVYDA
jgi:REP element-mobilizing transposase RayT